MLSMREMSRYHGHSEVVSSIAWSPDGTMIASADYDQTVQFWRPTTGERLALHEAGGYIGTVAWSPDGSRLASTMSESDRGNVVEIWDIHTGRRMRSMGDFLGEVGDVSWSPDGSLLAIGSWDGTVQVYTVATGVGGVIYTFDNNPGFVYAVDWSWDGALLAAAGDYGTVAVFQRHDWSPLLLSSPQRVAVFALTWLPHQYAIVASDGKDIRLWNVRTKELEAMYQGHTSAVFAVAASPNGHYLASGSGWDKTVRVWDRMTAQPLLILEGYSSQSQAVAWSPDSTCLAFAAEDNAIAVMRMFA